MKPLLITSLLASAAAFSPHTSTPRHSTVRQPSRTTSLYSSVDSAVEPKEAVKLFGRLAEKYIMLDSSGGLCCYSACKDCEFRLPGGGYRMADQSAARPKWIPSYETREANGKDHTTKWSSELFQNGPAVTKEEFVQALSALDYAPPLGGPYVGASAAAVEDTHAAECLFDSLVAEGKDKLTKHRMSVRLKELADGEEGLNWNGFQKALGL